MEGSAIRQQNERALVWYGAMMPHLKEPPSFTDFVGVEKRNVRQSPEELNAALTALAHAWGAEWVD